MTLEVANPGERAGALRLRRSIRASAGRSAAGRDGALVRFEREERAEVPSIAPGGLVAKTTKPVPLNGRDLPLTDALFANDAVCFLDCTSRSLPSSTPPAPRSRWSSPTSHAALWTRPGAPFLCLEAWTGYSDPEGFDGDLFEKPSMRVLAPGARARHEARFVYRAA